MILLVHLAVLGLLKAYSSLNLRPDMPAAHVAGVTPYFQWVVSLIVIAPIVLSVVFLRPVVAWARARRTASAQGAASGVSTVVVERAANAPLALAAFSLLGWMLFTVLVLGRSVMESAQLRPGLWAHLAARPLLAGLITASAVFFAAEHTCRTHVWPMLLVTARIADNPRLWRVRVSHRLLALWLAISVLPLGAVALTTFTRAGGVEGAADPALDRLVAVIVLISASASVGGAWLAWLVARSIGQPLEALEAAMTRLRGGDFTIRETVGATDEIGAVAEGFNLMAGRLAESYAALEVRNRELARALDRVLFLEHVKRGLDRFVPDTVRRAVEADPEAPSLKKAARDVTVLFLDIEGYSRLSEELPRSTLNTLVERYFSLFLAPIRAEGGDINETAGDGLMIIFQAGAPAEHAASAVRAARAIREQTALANRDVADHLPPIVVNIGISSGECDVGATRFAGPTGERWTFTASGPATNLAARLGDHAAGGQILLGPDTARRVREQFDLRHLGGVALKNLASAVDVWEVPGD